MRRLVGGWLVVCACFNPGGGEGTSTEGSPATTSTTAPTTTPGDATTVAVSTTDGTTTLEVTGDPTTGGLTTSDPATTDPATTMTDACGGSCGECKVCVAGACMANPGAPCMPTVDACGAQVHGVIGDKCYAAAPGPAPGTCSDLGTCEGGCDEVGPQVAVCASPECRKDPSPCMAGVAVARITLDAFCETQAATAKCGKQCDELNDVVVSHTCVAEGLCQPGPVEECNGFSCSAALDVCVMDCMMLPCAPGYSCMNTVCVPD